MRWLVRNAIARRTLTETQKLETVTQFAFPDGFEIGGRGGSRQCRQAQTKHLGLPGLRRVTCPGKP